MNRTTTSLHGKARQLYKQFSSLNSWMFFFPEGTIAYLSNDLADLLLLSAGRGSVVALQALYCKIVTQPGISSMTRF